MVRAVSRRRGTRGWPKVVEFADLAVRPQQGTEGDALGPRVHILEGRGRVQVREEAVDVAGGAKLVSGREVGGREGRNV